jgi:hypothetical protein
MASDFKALVENNIEPVQAGPLETLGDQRHALVDQHIEYRLLLDEQREMIRCMLEFTRVLRANARESLTRADQILGRQQRGGLAVPDRTNPSHVRDRRPAIQRLPRRF